MKLIFTLSFLMFAFALIAQDKSVVGIKLATAPGQEPVKIQMRCLATVSNGQPVFVIDGEGVKNLDLQLIDPNDIEHIEILKGSAATTLYGSPGQYGVIVITTKNAKLRQFSIRDIVDDNPILGVTVIVIPERKPADSMIAVSDEKGMVSINSLQANAKYRIRVSSVGYQNWTGDFINNKESSTTFQLSRNIIVNTPVVIVGYPTIRCRYLIQCGGVRILKAQVNQHQPNNNLVKVYPNPVNAGSQIKLEWNNETLNQQIQTRIMSLDGRVLFSRNYPLIKGSNLLTVSTENKWTPGMYMVQLMNENGKLMKQEKLLIQ